MTSFDSGRSLPTTPARSRWLVVVLSLLVLADPFALGWLSLTGRPPSLDKSGTIHSFVAIFSGVAFSTIGVLIFFDRPHNRIRWLCLGSGFGLPSVTTIDHYVTYGLTGQAAAPGLPYFAWIIYSYSIFALVPMFILLPRLYPTDRFLSPRWRQKVDLDEISQSLLAITMETIHPEGSSLWLAEEPVADMAAKDRHLRILFIRA